MMFRNRMRQVMGMPERRARRRQKAADMSPIDQLMASIDLDLLNAWNEDLDARTFGQRLNTLAWHHRDRRRPATAKGRVRIVQGLSLLRRPGSRDLTSEVTREALGTPPAR